MASLSGRMANFLSTRLPALGRVGTRRHVERYRSSGGTKAAEFRGKPVFLLDVVGRSSREPRPVMLMLVWRGDDLIVVGSNGGNPEAPNWWKNLMAAGGGHVEVAGDRWAVTAREVGGDEKTDCWELAREAYPDFETYQELTDREIPVAVLERV